MFILTTYTVIYLYVEAKSFSYHRAMSGAPQIPYLRRVAARIFRFPRPRRRSSLQQGQDLLSRQQRRDAERDRSHGRSYRRGHRQFYQHYPHLDSALTLEARQVKPLHPTLPGGGFDFPAHELEVLSSPSGQHPTLPGGGFNFPAHELQQLSATGETSAPKPEEHLVPVSSSGAGSGSGSAASLAPAAPVEAHDFARENAEPPPNETAEQQRHEYLANLGVPSVPEPAATAASAYRRDSVASVASSISSISSATSLTDTINDVPKASHDSIMAQHHRMKRQLRYMFVYPAVYIISWIPTFVSHIVKTNPSYYNDPSYALSAVIIIFSCSQATMDCVLFSIIEKPWRHIPGSSGTFFGSFNCLAIRRRRKRGDRDDPADVRERLARDLAYAARLDNAAPLDSSERPRQRRRISGRGRRYWWEVYEDDPSLSRAGRESVRRKRARADEVAEGRRRDSSELARKKVRRRSSFGDMEAEIGEASGHGTDSGSPQGDERHESGSDQSESSDGNRREERDTG